MEHKKTADNKTVLEDNIASRNEQLLKIPPPPPSYSPPLAPGERFRIEKIRRKSWLALKEKEKPQ